LTEISRNLNLSAVDWSDSIWKNFSPPLDSQIPAGTRFAAAIFKGQNRDLKAPALVPILNQGNLFFIARGAAKKQAVQAL